MSKAVRLTALIANGAFDNKMNFIKKEKLGIVLIVAIALAAIVALLLQNPIGQDPNYHGFSDARKIFSILNFWNVVSNVPFLVVGLFGLYKILVSGNLTIKNELKAAYILLFFGVMLVAFGSGYYHLSPNNQTLVWDRLPMTIAFMALFSIVISEFISNAAGKALLFPLIIIGVASVFYWHFGELKGAGDLRLYAFVQFFPMLVIPVILICFGSSFTEVKGYWFLLMAYIAAKLFEQFDAEVYAALGFMSGHAIKHALAALGLYILLVSYERRCLS